jgi:ABC-type multidrug transport system fused ATPase/permease subunit
MEDIITLKNIAYSYHGKIPALKNISFSIKRGEMFSIIGLNGSENQLYYISSMHLFFRFQERFCLKETVYPKNRCVI